MSEQSRITSDGQPITRVFLMTLALVVIVFFGYEVLEQLWLVRMFPGLIDVFHIMRGVGTALIVAGFITWYFVGIRPDQTARRILSISPLPAEEERQEQTREQICDWFIRIRWFVASVFSLGLIIAATINRGLLWQPPFLALIYLFCGLVVSNVIYRLLSRFETIRKYQLLTQIVVDFLFITLFLSLTGGVRNPAFILYVPHVLIVAVLMSPPMAYLSVAFSMVLFGSVGLLEYVGIIGTPSFPYIVFGGAESVVSPVYLAAVLLLFGGVLISTSFLASLVMRSLRDYRNNLRSEKERTQRLVEKLYSVREEERARVSRELHDQIGQSLSTIRLTISRLKSEIDQGATGVVESLEDTVESTIDEVRELSHRLRPSTLDECGLPCAIENYAEKIEAEHGINVDYEWLGMEHAENISREVDTALYRIAQEAVLNAVEHGDPDHISLILQRVGDDVQLLVEDDGRGFDREQIDHWQTSDTLGIHGMKERTNLLGGRFNLESSSGSGVRVRVIIPADATGNVTGGDLPGGSEIGGDDS